LLLHIFIDTHWCCL